MTQISAGGVAGNIVFLNRCIGNKPFIHNHYSMSMVRIMQTSVGKINWMECMQFVGYHIENAVNIFT